MDQSVLLTLPNSGGGNQRLQKEPGDHCLMQGNVIQRAWPYRVIKLSLVAAVVTGQKEELVCRHPSTCLYFWATIQALSDFGVPVAGTAQT